MLNSTDERRAELQSGYYFGCNCERCTLPEPVVDAAACPSSICEAACSIEEEKCKKCGEIISPEFKKIFEEASDFTKHHLQSMRTMACILLYDSKIERSEKRFNIIPH